MCQPSTCTGFVAAPVMNVLFQRDGGAGLVWQQVACARPLVRAKASEQQLGSCMQHSRM